MAHDHDHDSPEYLAKQSKVIWMVGLALFIATGITVAVTYVDFGSHAANIAVGILIAVIKAAMVALIFMHLKSERGVIYKVMFFTVILAIALFFLTWMSFAYPLLSKEIISF